jgi:hypothetical protein
MIQIVDIQLSYQKKYYQRKQLITELTIKFNIKHIKHLKLNGFLEQI